MKLSDLKQVDVQTQPLSTPSTNGVMFTPPPPVEYNDVLAESDDENLEGLSLGVALKIMTKLDSLIDNDKINIQDMKDITSMSKDVFAYVSKNASANKSSTTGLSGFLSRLKA